MGYDLRITRAPGFWAETESGGINIEEWMRVVEADPELSLEDGRMGFAGWLGPSRYPDPWFDWWRRSIKTKNPDPPMVEKMLQIASRLDARVQGDDGEIYLSHGGVEKDGVVDTGPGMDWRRW